MVPASEVFVSLSGDVDDLLFVFSIFPFAFSFFWLTFRFVCAEVGNVHVFVLFMYYEVVACMVGTCGLFFCL